MNKEDAIIECERYLAHLDAQRRIAKGMQEIARERRRGAITLSEARRKERCLRGSPAPVVHDASRLEKAIKALLREVEE